MFPLKLLFYNRGGGIMAKQVQAEKKPPNNKSLSFMANDCSQGGRGQLRIIIFEQTNRIFVNRI